MFGKIALLIKLMANKGIQMNMTQKILISEGAMCKKHRARDSPNQYIRVRNKLEKRVQK